MMTNSKNELHELVKDLGYLESVVNFSSKWDDEKQVFVAHARFGLPKSDQIEGIGFGKKKKVAEISASGELLKIIRRDYTHLVIDWEEVRKEAQLGDLLIKLYAYLSEEMMTAADKSIWLQQNETDQHLVKIFDRLSLRRHPSVSFLGENLGTKRKATWIEALIWRKFGKEILASTADRVFRDIYKFFKTYTLD